MKILFITLSNIGDAIMTTPVFCFLHKKYPDAKFDIVCDKKNHEVFKYFPNVDSIILKNKKKGLIDSLKFICTLRKKKYDIAIDLRTDILLYLIRSKEKFFKINDKNIHSVRKHFAALKLDSKSYLETNIYIPQSITNSIKKLIPFDSNKILCIAPGAKSNIKIWHVEHFVKLINKIQGKFDLIIIVGDSSDYERGNIIFNSFPKKIINFCGKLTLIETGAIIKKSNLFIGNDSGLGHLASAVGTKSFIIFGEGVPNRYAPWGKKSYWYQNPEKNINLIHPDVIYEKIKKFKV